MRRAPVEIVGTLESALFGILSREDADKYNEWIDSTEKASRRNIKLIREQNSILESTVNLFNESSSVLKIRLNWLEGYFNDTLDTNESMTLNRRPERQRKVLVNGMDDALQELPAHIIEETPGNIEKEKISKFFTKVDNKRKFWKNNKNVSLER